MRPPSLPWMGGNFLRLVAVVFLVWSLIAQFIAITNDLSAKLNVQPTNDTISDDSIESKSTTILVENEQLLTVSGVVRWPFTTSSTTSTSYLVVVATGTVITKSNGLTPQVGTALKDDNNLMKRTNESSQQRTEANYGLSGIPRQAGGICFAIISRLVVACTLVLLILGQLGWPEMFLYTWTPCLGPQSTPVWLGLAQAIVGIENLRVYSKSVVLISAWGLFLIGLLNIILGVTLLYLSRNLPKLPPPPLLFNLSQRLLFWTSLPPCYYQLSEQQVNEEKTEGENAEHPHLNAHEIRLDEEDEEKAVGTETHPWQRPQGPVAPIPLPDSGARPAYQDVARGGYPTFSGGGLTDAGRQVPSGILERAKDGRLTKFISENGEEVGKPGLPNAERYRQERMIAKKARMGHSRRQKGEEQSLDQNDFRDQLPPMNHSKRVPVPMMNCEKVQRDASARDKEVRESSKRLALSRSRSVQNLGLQVVDKVQKLLVAESSMQNDSLDPKRQSNLSSISGLSATENLGLQFPLPPDRQALGKSHTELNLLPRALELAEESTVALPLKRGIGPMRGLALPKSHRDKARAYKSNNRQNLKTNSKVDEEPPASAPPLSPAPSLSKTFLTPKVPQRKRAMTLNPHLNLQQPPRSSVAAVLRTNSARSAKSSRLARGVRFMDKVEEKSPTPIIEGTPITADSHNLGEEDSEDDSEVEEELEVTNFRLPLPTVGASKKEVARPESSTSPTIETDKASSSFDLEIDNEGSVVGTQRGYSNRLVGDNSHDRRRLNEKAGLPTRASRPKTVAILGGIYLDGRREINSHRDLQV
ncbi:hypothetical protein J010_01599 [Cryptococcus neoformans]|uniref:Uncharacterized protein n=1 Tax=Cryptococcus neoformans Tu259-1 TaxID=1230072 RepID=A0A854QJ93_CRYNE|nr:hypothetical protein C368_02455 [Cryptococcus neoformans var. grubii 125.91]OXG25662.1 hypothetical protein C361_01622 [Cryptococcus neoformans var. grubii Tu259-1]OXG52442.1 hypothetical protein C355_01727 [Cryptococcus neoformans var. grubii Th84]OXG85152.1 hypothetical protein C350_01626 [Cryptococcus neoformans var. grubii MW-RSA36]OXG90469.1 hypothetical protein C346_01667 [Cryptococcus neoformans var. grubii D17-1]OXG97973.1 hypothetical protein C345_01626 [Cryptococcus neoformans var